MLTLSSPDDVFGRGQTDSQNPMKIDSREVKCRINIYNLWYKFARVAGVPRQYHATQFNCDIIRNWLITDRLEWSLATPESRRQGFEATIASVTRDGLDRNDLQAIQNELNNGPARTDDSSQKQGRQRRSRSQRGSSQSPVPGPSGKQSVFERSFSGKRPKK